VPPRINVPKNTDPPKNNGPKVTGPDRPKGPSWTAPSASTPIVKAPPRIDTPKTATPQGNITPNQGSPTNSGPKKHWSTPKSGAPTIKPDAKATPAPNNPGGDFSTPIKPSGPNRLTPTTAIPTDIADDRRNPDRHWGGGHGGNHGNHHGGNWGHGGHHSGSGLSIGFGFGAGVSFTTNHWFGSHNFVNFSFSSSSCDYDPWISPSHCWYRPHFSHHGWRHRHRHFDPFWHCNPWGGFYYSRSCYPLTWYYPGYTWSAHPCGSYYRISYYRPHCHWLTNFSYCDTPCDTFSDCSLISPTVVVTAYDSPDVCWSPTTIYRHTYVNTVYADVPAQSLIVADDSLPAAASASELLGTTERELADTYMKLGDTDSAIRVYSAHVNRHPGDVVAVRALGIALIDRGETERGVEHVLRAYRIDPTLARNAFDRELLRDPDNLVAVLDRATTLANTLDGKSGAAAAWLTVAVLMQADARLEPSREALEKAKAAGLSLRVVDEMQAAVPAS
jgi:hypothetical protein